MYQDLIRQQREKLGLSQDELVNRLQTAGLEITRATLSNWETGRHPSPFDNVSDILVLIRVLELELSEVLKTAGNQLLGQELSEETRHVLLIMETLPITARQLVLEQVKVVQKYFSANP